MFVGAAILADYRKRRLRHGSCLEVHARGVRELSIRERIPRDAIRAECDLFAALVVFSPWLFYRWFARGKYREGWREKLRGKAPLRIGDQPCLWFHAVSVGEVLLLRPLVREMARRRPNWDVVISTTTSTGLAVARRTYPDLVTFYAPLDFSWSTRRAVARVRPTVLALVELELWPNLIRAAKRQRREGRDHQRPAQPAQLSWLSQPAAALASDAGPYRRRGGSERGICPRDSSIWALPGSRVSVTGSVKYDGLESDRNNAQDARAAGAFGPGRDRPGLRGGEHDGRGGGGGAGCVPGGAAAASRLAA